MAVLVAIAFVIWLACAIVPVFLLVLWAACEAYALAFVDRRKPGAFDLSPEEEADLVRSRDQSSRADRSLQICESEASHYRRRADGQLDERYSGARSLNGQIESLRREALHWWSRVDELEGRPMRRWSAWARRYRWLWAGRSGVATSAVLAIAGTRTGLWNLLSAVRKLHALADWSLPDPGSSTPWFVVFSGVVSATLALLGFQIGGWVANLRIPRPGNPAHGTAGGWRMLNAIGGGAAVALATVAVLQLSVADVASPGVVEGAPIAPDMPPAYRSEAPSAEPMDRRRPAATAVTKKRPRRVKAAKAVDRTLEPTNDVADGEPFRQADVGEQDPDTPEQIDLREQ